MRLISSIQRLVVLGIITLVVVSCTSDSPVPLDSSNLNTAEIAHSLQMDHLVSTTQELLIATFLGVNTNISDGAILPSCAVINTVNINGMRQTTIEFPKTGCVDGDNRLLKGKMEFSYALPLGQVTNFNYDFEDFSIDGIDISGGDSGIYYMNNSSGFPEFIVDLSTVLVWEDGTQGSRVGTLEQEWREGVHDGDPAFNLWYLTGSWNTTFSNGDIHNTEVLLPIHRKANCRYFVDGAFKITRASNIATIKYGSGACDNNATMILNDDPLVGLEL